jgi:hypothetical protein
MARKRVEGIVACGGFDVEKRHAKPSDGRIIAKRAMKNQFNTKNDRSNGKSRLITIYV